MCTGSLKRDIATWKSWTAKDRPWVQAQDSRRKAWRCQKRNQWRRREKQLAVNPGSGSREREVGSECGFRPGWTSEARRFGASYPWASRIDCQTEERNRGRCGEDQADGVGKRAHDGRAFNGKWAARGPDAADQGQVGRKRKGRTRAKKN
mgnify:CR=1 FL=1